MQIIKSIQNRIYEIRGERVMLDRDLAALYETETKGLNLAVKRNIKRFSVDFMFQLTKEEYEALRFQNETSYKSDNPLRLQNETSKGRGGTRYLPYAFYRTRSCHVKWHLNSEKAINMNIAIMRAFVEVRKVLLHQHDPADIYKCPNLNAQPRVPVFLQHRNSVFSVIPKFGTLQTITLYIPYNCNARSNISPMLEQQRNLSLRH